MDKFVIRQKKEKSIKKEVIDEDELEEGEEEKTIENDKTLEETKTEEEAEGSSGDYHQYYPEKPNFLRVPLDDKVIFFSLFLATLKYASA